MAQQQKPLVTTTSLSDQHGNRYPLAIITISADTSSICNLKLNITFRSFRSRFTLLHDAAILFVRALSVVVNTIGQLVIFSGLCSTAVELQQQQRELFAAREDLRRHLFP